MTLVISQGSGHTAGHHCDAHSDSQMQALPKNFVPGYELSRGFNVPALEIFLVSSRNLRGQEMKKTQVQGFDVSLCW